jgi:polyisoprenoid-binding protein YceI
VRGVNRITKLSGVAALLAWTTLGIVGWAVVARGAGERLRGEERAAAPSAELLSVSDELGALHEDVRAIARALSENLQTLHDELDARLEARASALEAEVTRLQRGFDVHREAELVRMSRELEPRGGDRSSDLDAAALATPTAVAAAPPEAVEPAQFAPAPSPSPPARKSFLAFELPSDQLRFEGRRTWTVLPSLSRVGFDAQSTLHDFTGTTSRVEGTLEVDPSHPADAPHAFLRVQAASLATGVDGRDEALREHLATSEHPELVFELEAFDAATVDVSAQRVAGTARGKMTIRGVTRAVAMPVTLALDAARRLSLEGEMIVHLPDFGVPVPNKLGLISMQEDVKVWIAIKLRASSRTEG